MSAWLILLLHELASRVDGLTDDRHLTTDPACAQYRARRPGSRLDRMSRGVSCTPCMIAGSYFGDECIPFSLREELA
ncbi:hypothetical protein SCB71_06400 [Herbiconiux sp. KACC 21604]|uniref:hypothetical protein n=1 Tax=unclassified Herbiconiux TaxID=2618217 RepID=UPI0014918144|nr:hypothetical protein [Herbiconiux sp. SALV-R1]QJU52947.1 hypothetical protein HL652_04385 [Herbiconiux sp. SALV-R1]WPO87869.1 hypothetical protein SCB71_06400 [Herbiconiux sp. KACC 21604]